MKSIQPLKHELAAEDDPDLSIPFRYDLSWPDEARMFGRYLISKAYPLDQITKARLSSLDKMGHAVALVTANLLRAYQSNPKSFVAISLNRNDFVRTRYQPETASYTHIQAVLSGLSRTHPPLLQYLPGFNDRKTGIGKTARIRATGYLIRMWFNYELLWQAGHSIVANRSSS